MRFCFTAAALFGLLLPVLQPDVAAAQAIAVTVNGDPVTTLDIDQRMKLLRVLRKPATREAAVEDLIKDRLKTREAEKYGVRYNDADVGQQIGRIAADMKMAPGALTGALSQAGVQQDQIRSYFGSILVFDALIRGLNKGVEASETQVRAELAKEQAKGGLPTEYVLRQVVFTTPVSATPGDLAARAKAAEQLRTRFTSCDSGASLVRESGDAVMREPLTRTASQLGDGLRQVLDKTPVGHLTPPQRTSGGLEMVALCSRGPTKDDTALRSNISDKLLTSHYEEEAARKIKELRAHAVITKPQG